MQGELRVMNYRVKQYDKNLCARMDRDRICIYERRKKFVPLSYNGMTIYFLTPYLDLVFPLTSNWRLDGEPINWGSEVVIARLRAHDLMHDPEFLEKLNKANEKVDESKDRDFSNNVEAFLKDFRRQFGRTFNDVNTSLLPKIDKRRLKDGNRKS